MNCLPTQKYPATPILCLPPLVVHTTLTGIGIASLLLPLPELRSILSPPMAELEVGTDAEVMSDDEV